MKDGKPNKPELKTSAKKIKCKVLVAIAGANFSYSHGDIVSMDKSEAERHAKNNAVEILK